MVNFTKKCFITALACMLMAGTASAASHVRVYVNGMRVNEDVILQNDRTYIPLRAVSEAMGAQVDWDGNTSSAYITFSEDDAIAQLVENVSPSVVTIVGNYNDSSDSGQFNNPTMHGSGVIYKNNGHIITNAHVVKDIKNLTVVLSNGETYPGKVLFSDEAADLAIVKIEKLGLTPITMADPSAIVSGKTVIAIGTPISLSMRNTVTKGIISGVDVVLPDSHYKILQTDASVNPGNSGGPLLNIRGELVGINSSKFAGVGIEGMCFAIPVDTVKHAISQYEQHGKILRPTLPFTLQESWEAKIGLPTLKGLTVKNVSGGELANGDVITALNDIPVHSLADWNEAIKDTYTGSGITVTFTRGGEAYVSHLTN